MAIKINARQTPRSWLLAGSTKKLFIFDEHIKGLLRCQEHLRHSLTFTICIKISFGIRNDKFT